jgi:hypothetical protein
MTEFAALLNAIATLLWPILAFVLLVMVRKELPDLLGRLRKGKFFGQEVELDKSLDKLQASVVSFEFEVVNMPAVHKIAQVGPPLDTTNRRPRAVYCCTITKSSVDADFC